MGRGKDGTGKPQASGEQEPGLWQGRGWSPSLRAQGAIHLPLLWEDSTGSVTWGCSPPLCGPQFPHL